MKIERVHIQRCCYVFCSFFFFTLFRITSYINAKLFQYTIINICAVYYYVFKFLNILARSINHFYKQNHSDYLFLGRLVAHFVFDSALPASRTIITDN